MSSETRNSVDHVAIRVKDFDWYVDFFHTALQLEITKREEGQIWLGGIQLTQGTEKANGENAAVWHIALKVDNVAATLHRIYRHSEIRMLDGKREWPVLPNGVVLEIMEKDFEENR